jgi:hypothetical protein
MIDTAVEAVICRCMLQRWKVETANKGPFPSTALATFSFRDVGEKAYHDGWEGCTGSVLLLFRRRLMNVIVTAARREDDEVD